MRFGDRELTSYAEPVSEDSLKEGQVYFSVQYVDENLLIPTMETLVFVGKHRSSDNKTRLRFQDIGSYEQGVRYDSARAKEAQFQTMTQKNINHIFEYEPALDELMRCALRRKKAPGVE